MFARCQIAEALKASLDDVTSSPKKRVSIKLRELRCSQVHVPDLRALEMILTKGIVLRMKYYRHSIASNKET